MSSTEQTSACDGGIPANTKVKQASWERAMDLLTTKFGDLTPCSEASVEAGGSASFFGLGGSANARDEINRGCEAVNMIANQMALNEQATTCTLLDMRNSSQFNISNRINNKTNFSEDIVGCHIMINNREAEDIDLYTVQLQNLKDDETFKHVMTQNAKNMVSLISKLKSEGIGALPGTKNESISNIEGTQKIADARVTNAMTTFKLDNITQVDNKINARNCIDSVIIVNNDVSNSLRSVLSNSQQAILKGMYDTEQTQKVLHSLQAEYDSEITALNSGNNMIITGIILIAGVMLLGSGLAYANRNKKKSNNDEDGSDNSVDN